MKLPASLAPWARQLKIFPDEISLALGALAQKISPFVSPLRSQEEISDREPNGYDGVARRGIYERLLLSELALADEISEEFVRRAVMGEHLFLNLARVAPSAKRMSLALFSAGAEQLGTPRIAHLAALIVLARRAESVKAAFAWGVLQDKELKTFSEVTESNVLSLINARTAEALKPGHIEKWREKLRELETVADVWLLGGNNLKDFKEAKGFSLLTFEDVLEPGARRLELSVASSSGSRKQTTLELPDEAICTRLLRNPFEVYKAPEKVNLTTKLSSFFFDENGGKIFGRGDDKTVLYLPVANSPNAVTGSPRRYPLYHPNDLLLAAGRLGKSVATVAFTEAGHLRLDYPKTGNFRLPQGNYLLGKAELILPDDNKTLLPIYNLRFPDSPFFQAAFTDAKNNLFILNRAYNIGKDIVGRALLNATDVLAATRTERRFVFVGCEPENKVLRIISYGEQTKRREIPLPHVTQAFFGRGGGVSHPTFGLLALGDEKNHFVIIKNDEEKYIDATPTSEVVGVFYDAGFSPEVGLFELEEDRRTLNFNVGRKHNKQVFISGEEIEKIVFSPRSPVCAYQTISGKIIIFSLTRRVPIGTFGS
jgi:hypothetical protein